MPGSITRQESVPRSLSEAQEFKRPPRIGTSRDRGIEVTGKRVDEEETALDGRILSFMTSEEIIRGRRAPK